MSEERGPIRCIHCGKTRKDHWMEDFIGVGDLQAYCEVPTDSLMVFEPTRGKVVSPQDLMDALRSGEYIKGHGQLREEFESRIEWCCLGVACDLAEIDLTPIDPRQHTTYRGGRGPTLGNISTPYHLPEGLRYQFEQAFPWMSQSDQDKLADLNDSSTDWEEVVIHHITVIGWDWEED